jgi:hypothetical protein
MSISNSQFKSLFNAGTPAGEAFGRFRSSMGGALKTMGTNAQMQSKSTAAAASGSMTSPTIAGTNG